MGNEQELYTYFVGIQRFSEKEWPELNEALRIHEEAHAIYNETLQAMSAMKPRNTPANSSRLSTCSDTWRLPL